MRISFKISLDIGRKPRYDVADEGEEIPYIDEKGPAHIERAEPHPVGFSANPCSLEDW